MTGTFARRRSCKDWPSEVRAASCASMHAIHDCTLAGTWSAYSDTELDVSTYHLAVDIASDYGPMLRMLPPEHWPQAHADPRQLVDHLLLLGSRMSPKQLATSKRKPNNVQPKG